MHVARLVSVALVLLGAPAALAAPAAAQARDPKPPTGIEVGPPPPTTSTTGDPSVVDAPEKEGGPGFFDVAGRIKKAINDWFRDLVTSALDPILDLLGKTVLATPLVTGMGRVRDLWGTSAVIANTAMGLLALVGAAVAMSHETIQTRYTIKDVAPRLVVAVIAANASLGLAGQAVVLANALSRAFLGSEIEAQEASLGMKALVLGPVGGGGIFIVLIGGVAAALALVLLVVYVVRVALTILLVAAGPLALATHALPQTDGIARLWWRALAGVLAIQVGQALVFVAALRVFFAADGRSTLGLSAGGTLVDLLIVLTLLWVLLRIPTWVGRAVFSSGRVNATLRAVQNIVVYRTAGAMSGA